MKKTTWFVLAGLAVALVLAGVVSSFAAGAPDGLDAASTRGCTVNAAGEITGGSCIAQGAKDQELDDSPFAGYSFAGFDSRFLSTAASGVAGVLITFAFAGGLFWLTRRRASAATARPPVPRSAPAGRD
jgi:cobalt/nickel transport protein